jgi:tRNA(Ile)-lysidine synthase
MMNGFTPPHVLSGMPKETPILLALSGGADSRALLHLLLEYGAPLSIAHVDHGIRGEASERDSMFCRELAKEANVPFYLLKEDVPALAEKNHLGIEEQARDVRYDFFEKIMREHDIPILATAHNADDNAETLLFRMARGTGLCGMCGIPPVRPFGGGVIIRPLLSISKQQILDYCKQNGLSHVTDETNSDVAYTRNRIRHKVLPELAKINPEAISHISSLCRTLSEDEACLWEMAQDFIQKQRCDGDGVSAKDLCALPPALSNRVLSLMFGEPPLSLKNREQLMELAKKAVPHSRADLSDGRHAVIERGRLMPKDPHKRQKTPLTDTALPLGTTSLYDGEMLMVLDSEKNPNENRFSAKNIYKNETTIKINSDTIKKGLYIRTRREGDTVLVRGMHKKLRKLQNEAMLSPDLRDTVPLVLDRDGILWAPMVALRDNSEGDGALRLTLFY